MSTDQNSGSLKDKFAGFGAEPSEGLFDAIYHSTEASAGSLSEKFEGFGAAPSAGLWESILARLEGKRRRRIIIWWWTGGVAALFLFGLTINGMINADEVKQRYSERTAPIYSFPLTDEVSEESNHEGSWNTGIANSADEKLFEEFPIDANKDRFNKTGREDQNHPSEIRPKEKLVVVNQKVNDEKESDVKEIPENDHSHAVGDDQKSVDILNLPLSDLAFIPVNPEVLSINLDPLKVKKSGWEFGIEYDYWTAIRDPFVPKKEDLAALPVSSLTDSEENFVPITNTDISLAESANYNNEPATIGSIQKPLNLNLTARYHFNPRVSIHSGLNYSRHFFRTAYNSNQLQYTTSAINSIGVPIGFKWNFFHRPAFDIYTDVQQLFELPFSERTEEVNFLGESNKVQGGFASGLLLSAQTGLGFRYGLTEKISVNMSANLRYYYLQRVNGTAPLHQENMWLGARIGISWRL